MGNFRKAIVALIPVHIRQFVVDQVGQAVMVGLALFVLFYFKSRSEELLLTAHYPQYPACQEKVGWFTPWI